MAAPRGVELKNLQGRSVTCIITMADLRYSRFGTYRRLVALGNQPVVILSVNLQNWGLFGIKARLGSGERRQDTNCQSAEGGMMHGTVRKATLLFTG